MRDDTADFFAALAERGHEPLLEAAKGMLCFELENGGNLDRWYVSVEKGDVAVSREERTADCTVRTDKQLFDGVVSGEVNSMAALLRGAILVEGDPELLVRFQRLFPGPPRSQAEPERAPGEEKP